MTSAQHPGPAPVLRFDHRALNWSFSYFTPVAIAATRSYHRTSVLINKSQRIGPPVQNWVSPAAPKRESFVGQFCTVAPLDPQEHGAALFQANMSEGNDGQWTYLPYGPFPAERDYLDWLQAAYESPDPLYYATLDSATGLPTGVASYLRIDTTCGVIEVGHINFSPLMQRSPIGTETMFLMMRNVFNLGYRRYEWKCDALNHRSRQAALRLGFQYEGTFRQAAIYKGRNRDTAWFSIIDKDWPRLSNAFGAWLDPLNFDQSGRQLKRLSDLTT